MPTLIAPATGAAFLLHSSSHGGAQGPLHSPLLDKQVGALSTGFAVRLSAGSCLLCSVAVALCISTVAHCCVWQAACDWALKDPHTIS